MGDWAASSLRRSLAVLSGVAPLLCALPARAEPFQVAGGGVFLGYAFGERGGFEWGIEGFATRYLEPHSECESSEVDRHGIGPLLRVSAIRASRLTFTLAAHGGGDLPGVRSFGALDGELGARVILESGRDTLLAPHSGLTLESIIFNVHFRQAWLFQPESLSPLLSLGGGARYIPTYGLPGFCVDGRPYRGELGEQQRASSKHDARFDVRNPRARLWAKRAAEECASVPAFLQLARELLELGAPLSLVARAVQAADEELGHTRAATRLAEMFGGASLSLIPPPYRPRPRLPRAQALERLAAESWLDGCVNEGFAATIAAVETNEASSAEEAAGSRKIAREEASHAALAFDVLRFARTQAPDAVRRLSLPATAASVGPTGLSASAAQELQQLSRRVAWQHLEQLRS